ncbi:MAG: PadR family transcriptional regulator [Nocardioides sp.]
MSHEFNRQRARHAEQQWNQHKGNWSGSWGEPPWGRGLPGPPPWVAGLFGLAQGEQQRGPRVRRGDVRTAILDVLATEPMNGYQLITQITERTQGAWKPSPGSVYPTLSQLEDEGLVEGDDTRGRRVLRLTAEGRAYVEANAEELARVWAPFAEPERAAGADYSSLKPEIGQVMSAVWQIVSTGTEQQRRDAIEILVDTRRRLYGLLADGDQGEIEGEGEGSQP